MHNYCLDIKEGYLGILYTFEIGYDMDINRDVVLERLNTHDIIGDMNFIELQYIKIAMERSFSEKLSRDYNRVQLQDISFDISIRSGTKTIIGNTYFSWDRDCNIGILLVNIDIGGLDVDDIIFIRQQYYGTFNIDRIIIEGFNEYENDKLSNVIDNYIDTIIISIHKYTSSEINNAFVINHLIEIRSIGNSEYNDEEDIYSYITEYHSNELYGLLTCDEGYRYVPSTAVLEGINDNWSSRSFLSIFNSNFTTLMFNMTSSKLFNNYIESQKELRNERGKTLEDYFKILHSSKLVGTNHDVLLLLENYSILRYKINQILDSKLFNEKSTMIKNNIKRKSIINMINKASDFGVMEVDNMETILAKNMRISEDIAKVKYNLDMRENELHLKYEQMMNVFFAILTIMGIILTILQFRN